MVSSSLLYSMNCCANSQKTFQICPWALCARHKLPWKKSLAKMIPMKIPLTTKKTLMLRSFPRRSRRFMTIHVQNPNLKFQNDRANMRMS